MSSTSSISGSAPIRADELEFWVERRGGGPDVLLIAGFGDPAEAWQPQLDGHSSVGVRPI